MSKLIRENDIGFNRLPLVIQVGFAGARVLVDGDAHPTLDEIALQEFEKGVAQQLATILEEEIQNPLKKKGQVFFSGISQIAVGGDFAFSRACEQIGWTHRIFLPQHLDAYLAAEGTESPDFSDTQRLEANDILSRPNIIQERLVSESNNRSERFEEVNIEIVRETDLIVALVRKDQESKPGGTNHLIELAKRKKDYSILKVVVGMSKDNSPILTHEWIGSNRPKIPALPPSLKQKNAVVDCMSLWCTGESSTPYIPKRDLYIGFLRQLGSNQAKWKQTLFKRFALIILVSHLLATIIAVIALKLDTSTYLQWLLGIEICLLFTGFMAHQWLHKSHAVESWASYRLLAEISRSVRGIGLVHIHLKHLFYLPFPERFLPLLRTINVMHLHATKQYERDWRAQRAKYVADRLMRGGDAQIPYHEKKSRESFQQLRVAQVVFIIASILAISATVVKLLTALGIFAMDTTLAKQLKTSTGFLAVVLPVFAVAALSLAAAFDLNAKEKTSKDLVNFLRHQIKDIERAESASEFTRLVLQTETQLLGENANWYARRAYVTVA